MPVIELRPAYPGEVGGHEVPAAAVRHRLEQVGANLSGTDPIVVVPPPWRPDLQEAIDLVEEVLRLEGYDTLPVRLPPAPAGHGLTPIQRRCRAVSRALAAAGLVEVQTSPFTASNPLGLADDDPRHAALQLLNPLSAQEHCLRTTLLPGLLAALARNVSRGRHDVALYETGAVFRPRPVRYVPPPAPAARPTREQLEALDASLPDQPQQAALVIAGLAEPAGWWGPGRPVDWSDAVAAALEVGAALGIELTVSACPHEPWHPGRCARLALGDLTVGHAGELHPRLLERLELPARTCAAELWLDPLVADEAAATVVAAPISSYPPGLVGVALVVEDGIPAERVERALRTGAGELLESVALFDLFRGAPVPDGHRSLAYTLTFRAPDRTLSGDEVNAMRDAAIAAAATETGAVLRG
jgi:phenylalanyl-tRNA synthetase beta chain